jgi:putative membrane protein
LKTVIFAIDRDNDFGEKLGLKGPIIGRRANLKAAVSMGLEDPEESDMNALFAAIRLYDQLKAEGEDVEVATLLGDDRVGFRSDRALAKNLEAFLKDHTPEEAIVVTDGAEDEQILPIIQSRISVSSVQRCIVKQSETAESTYYILKRTFEEERIAQKIFVPVFLIMIVYALFAFTEFKEFAWYAIILAVGIYGLLYFVNASELVSEWYRKTKVSIVTSQISFFSNIVAAVLVILGGLFALNQTVDPNEPWVFTWEGFLVFVAWFVWFAVAAALVRSYGQFLDAFIGRNRIQWSIVSQTFALLALGLISWGSVVVIGTILAQNWAFEDYYQFGLASIVAGIIIALLGSVAFRNIRDRVTRRKESSSENLGE